jgi:hypothetical protein
MQFRKCSIGGKVYGKGYTEISISKAKLNNEKIDEVLIIDESQLKDKFVYFVDPQNEMQELLKSENQIERERAYMFWKCKKKPVLPFFHFILFYIIFYSSLFFFKIK